MNFKGKKIVITGASPDFGQTLAILFAQLGAELYLSARTMAKVKATEALVKENVPEALVHSFEADVAKATHIADFADKVSRLSAEVDILINNASYWIDGSILTGSVSDEDIIEAIDSTATGSILMTKYFLPLLENSKNPDIVFINGTPGLYNNRHESAHEAFSAAKAAQSTFADRLRFRQKGTGMRVMTIYPPNFENTSPLNEGEWNERRGHDQLRYLTARNVFEGIKFALSQDRICCIDKIIMSNNNPSKKECLHS